MLDAHEWLFEEDVANWRDNECHPDADVHSGREGSTGSVRTVASEDSLPNVEAVADHADCDQRLEFQ